jgi:hypothetical protein
LYFAVNGVTIDNMEYLLTDHAKKRIAKRRICFSWIEETLAYPARMESDRDDATLVHVLRPIAECGFRVLRVIYNETVIPVAIVTAYFDDEVKDL